MKIKKIMPMALATCMGVALLCTNFQSVTQFSAGGPTKLFGAKEVFTLSPSVQLDYCDQDGNPLYPSMSSNSATVLRNGTLLLTQPGKHIISASFLSLKCDTTVYYDVLRLAETDFTVYLEDNLGFHKIDSETLIPLDKPSNLWVAKDGVRAELFKISDNKLLNVPHFVTISKEGVIYIEANTPSR